jgi:hypothetical protein
MGTLNELDVVRILSLRVPDRPFEGSPGWARDPRVGDLGTIVHVASTCDEDSLNAYLVECVDKSGMTVWLAEFTEAELELVWQSE